MTDIERALRKVRTIAAGVSMHPGKLAEADGMRRACNIIEKTLNTSPAEREDIVPGCMRCAKCGFQLQRTTLFMGNGASAPGDNKTEPCPNGCGPLWPVTWEQEARDWWKAGERMQIELMELRTALRACAPALRLWQGRAGLGEVAESISFPQLRFAKTAEEYTAQMVEADRLLAIIARLDADAPTDSGENHVQ